MLKRQSLERSMPSLLIKSHTGCDSLGTENVQREVIFPQSKHTLLSLCTPFHCVVELYVYKHNDGDLFSIYDTKIFDASLKIVKEDLSNEYKSYCLMKLMGVHIKTCEQAYYCIQNNTVIASTTVDTLNKKLILECKTSFEWKVTPVLKSHLLPSTLPCSPPPSPVGHAEQRCFPDDDYMSEVMICMGIGSPPPVTSFSDLTGLCVLDVITENSEFMLATAKSLPLT